MKSGDKVKIVGRSCINVRNKCSDHPNGIDGCIGDVGVITIIDRGNGSKRRMGVNFNGSENGAKHWCSFKEDEVVLFNYKELI
jgi:hypothetical protein